MRFGALYFACQYVDYVKSRSRWSRPDLISQSARAQALLCQRNLLAHQSPLSGCGPTPSNEPASLHRCPGPVPTEPVSRPGLLSSLWPEALPRPYGSAESRCADGRDGREYERSRDVCKLVRRQYADLRADDFVPEAMKAAREMMVNRGLSPVFINKLIGRVQRMFRWAVAEGVIPPTNLDALQVVAGLRSAAATRGKRRSPCERGMA